MNAYLKFPKKIKLKMMKLYFEKGLSMPEISAKYNINVDYLRQCIKRYKMFGEHAFETGHNRRRKFHESFKIEVVKAVLNGDQTIKGSAHKLNIETKEIRAWINWYNSIYNCDMKYIKLARNRKLEIAKYCINNNCNYSETAKKYNVNYSSVYNWVRIYQLKGDEAFITRDEERKIIKQRKVKAEKDDIDFVFDYLKKNYSRLLNSYKNRIEQQILDSPTKKV